MEWHTVELMLIHRGRAFSHLAIKLPTPGAEFSRHGDIFQISLGTWVGHSMFSRREYRESI